MSFLASSSLAKAKAPLAAQPVPLKRQLSHSADPNKFLLRKTLLGHACNIAIHQNADAKNNRVPACDMKALAHLADAATAAAAAALNAVDMLDGKVRAPVPAAAQFVPVAPLPPLVFPELEAPTTMQVCTSVTSAASWAPLNNTLHTTAPQTVQIVWREIHRATGASVDTTFRAKDRVTCRTMIHTVDASATPVSTFTLELHANLVVGVLFSGPYEQGSYKTLELVASKRSLTLYASQTVFVSLVDSKTLRAFFSTYPGLSSGDAEKVITALSAVPVASVATDPYGPRLCAAGALAWNPNVRSALLHLAQRGLICMRIVTYV